MRFLKNLPFSSPEPNVALQKSKTGVYSKHATVPASARIKTVVLVIVGIASCHIQSTEYVSLSPARCDL